MNLATGLGVVDPDLEDQEDQEDRCVVDMDHLEVAGMVIEVDMVIGVDMEDEAGMADEVVMEVIGEDTEEEEEEEEEEHHHHQDEINHDHDHPSADDLVHRLVGM